MKTADVRSLRASLESARQYVSATKATLEKLRQRRAQITADVDALSATPLRWIEAIDEIVEKAVDDCAGRYTPSLGVHIRERNPNLAERSGYDSLPFLGVPDVTTRDPLQNVGLFDGVSSHALCFFLPDLLKPRLRELLLSHPAPFPDDQCISGKDRDAQRKALDDQLQAINAEIAELQAELNELREDS